MKTWTIPTAVAQQFAANDYVSSCTFTLKCDVPMNGFTQFAIEFGKSYPVCGGNGKTMQVNGEDYYLSETTYMRCDEPYHAVSTNGEFIPVSFTHGEKDGKAATLDQPISAYFWAVFCDCGTHEEPHLIQGHATMSNDLTEANLS